MAGYNSKFTGQQVDSLLEKAGSSYQKPETGIPQSDLDESTQQILQNVENKVNKEEGKGLSTNDFTDEYKAKVEDSASQEGYFPKMSVGIAANLAGRGEATEQVFTYRPTDGGTSIESGVAKIRRVKGNSVVWNQLVDNNTLFIGERNGMVISKNEDGSITFNGTASADIFYNLVNLSIPIGHKVALTGVDNMSPFTFFLNGGVGNTLTSSGILTCSRIGTNGSGRMFLYITANTTFNNVTINPKIHYLTRMFGIGNEPNTIEEFRALYPDSYYPYNAGELRNLVCSGLKTVGFNQWDEQWEYGNIDSYTGVTTALSNCIRSTNFIPVIGGKSYYFSKKDGAEIGLYAYDDTYNFIGVYDNDDFAPSAGTTKVTNKSIQLPTNAKYIKFRVYPYTTSTSVNDICINLHHTGWRDGDYEPYKEFTHSLPLSQITNGEPLRKAGSVYDEINETHYIKRVGVRPYTEGDENDATLLTDETNTNYPLAEPIVTPIEIPLNLDYQAEDFGTEEALLTENSAPFSADIVYQFNAVDRIRANSLDIEDLLARVIALENAAATTTSIPDIPDITE